MSAQRFIEEYNNPRSRSVGSKIGGMLPVSGNKFLEHKNESDVSNMENALLINGLYEKLGLEVPDVHDKAVEMVGLHREKKVVDKQIDVFEKREAAYHDGSILEKARRMLGGAPVDPRKQEELQPVINIQLPTELLGAQQPKDERIDKLEEQFRQTQVQLTEQSQTFSEIVLMLKNQFDGKQGTPVKAPEAPESPVAETTA